MAFFINNNINVKYIAENNRFSIYDFIIEKDGIKYIVELKSRLQKIEYHTIELICFNKIQAFKKIVDKAKKTKILFIFNHVESQDNYKFYYYLVDLKIMDDTFFINYDCYDKPTHQI